MSYNQNYNKWGSFQYSKTNTTGGNNVQNVASVGKTKMKNRRITYSAQHLLQNYANEQLIQSQKIKSKNNSNIQQQQQPAFKILDLEAEKNSNKISLNNSTISSEKIVNEFNVESSVLPKSGGINDSYKSSLDDATSNPTYSFAAASHLDSILTLKNPYKTANTQNIKPPTVKLSSAELGNLPQVSTNPFIPSRSEMDQSLIKLANEKKTKVDHQQKKKLSLRVVGDIAWEDSNLLDFDPNDFRIFVGDLGHEVTDEMLKNAFSAYPSLQKVRVIRRPGARKNRGYGFVSFKNPNDYLKAMKEMNGKYIGVRPIKCRKSTWKERSLDTVIKKQDEKRKHGYKV